MKSNFVLFGLTHWLILCSIPATAWTLSRLGHSVVIRVILGAFLFLNELVYYGWKIQKGWFQFPAGLPLQLCDLIVWLTVIACFTRNRWAFEFAFFTGLVGTSMAVLTPDLQQPWPSYNTIYFFLAHGGIVATLLYLWWSGQARPQPGCLKRVMLVLNAYAMLLGAFNAFFGTNYMYLCRKPEAASLLDQLGPWPVYLLAGELVALALFAVLWLPFRRSAAA
ncbi:MAG: TIGR02206 family membrane protein [Bryobacterales bacterium]|nr:TIGR02206 family membrane protein [Bryobacterales bacterium]